MSKRHQVIQLHPYQHDLITSLLATEKAEDILPRAKWKYPNGARLGDEGPYPVILEVNCEGIYLDGDHPSVELCVGVLNNGRAALVAHSTNQNPERSFCASFGDNRSLTGRFELDEYNSFEFRRALVTSGECLIPVDEHGRPMKDAPGKYDQAARHMGGATEHKAPAPTASRDYEVLEDVRTTWNKAGDMARFERALKDIWRARSSYGPKLDKATSEGDEFDCLPLAMRYRPGDYEDAANIARGEVQTIKAT